MIDRPKFKEIAYEVKGKGTVMPYKDVEDIYDTVELKMDGIWGVFKCNLRRVDYKIANREDKEDRPHSKKRMLGNNHHRRIYAWFTLGQ